MRLCNQHILEAIQLARRLLALADDGQSDAQDDHCAVLFGVIRDCSYRILRQAEQEQELHKSEGRWDMPGSETPSVKEH